ncbi:MAG: acyl carrier protein [Candidatus Krumholzibacteria bacterium]|nr:acyl carrier protein [Candidatus Krumholzibacteria bacterium]
MEQIVAVVIACIQEVFKNKGQAPPSVRPEDTLDAEFGLDSLDYAELVIRLEEKTGMDPFADGTPGNIRSVADLAALYGPKKGA